MAVPTGFTKDTWITSVEIRPEHPEVTHHICMGFVPHNPAVEYYAPQWVDRARGEDGSALPEKGSTFGPDFSRPRSRTSLGGAAEDCYLPGNPAADYRVVGAAKLVPAGYDLWMSMHYTPNGTAVTDHVQVGFTLAKEAPLRRYVSLAASAPFSAKLFAIPPGNANWASPPGEVTFLEDAELVYLMPHMHMRGKDMRYTLQFPDGKEQVVLSVPRYDFNWQLGYSTSVKVPKGTVLRVDAHFDNSPNNKFNPNPDKTVYYGEMTWEEMMVGFFGVVVDKDVNPAKILKRPAGIPAPAGA